MKKPVNTTFLHRAIELKKTGDLGYGKRAFAASKSREKVLKIQKKRLKITTFRARLNLWHEKRES